MSDDAYKSVNMAESFSALKSIQRMQRGIYFSSKIPKLDHFSNFNKRLKAFHENSTGIRAAIGLSLSGQKHIQTFQRAFVIANQFKKLPKIDNSIADLFEKMSANSTLSQLQSMKVDWDVILDLASISCNSALLPKIDLSQLKSNDKVLMLERVLSDPDSIAEITEAVTNIAPEELAISDLEEDIKKSEKILKSVEDPKDFIEKIKKLPSMLLWFFVFVVLPIIINLTSAYLKPAIDEYLENNDSSDTDKVRAIKGIPGKIGQINTTGLRFITGNNVRLREEPSTKSDILDELVLGQVVEVLSKKRNWIEVCYEYPDGEIVTGWVFTRYTTNFVR